MKSQKKIHYQTKIELGLSLEKITYLLLFS